MRLTFVLGHFRLDVSLCEDDEEPVREVESTATTEIAAPPFGFLPESEDRR